MGHILIIIIFFLFFFFGFFDYKCILNISNLQNMKLKKKRLRKNLILCIAVYLTFNKIHCVMMNTMFKYSIILSIVLTKKAYNWKGGKQSLDTIVKKAVLITCPEYGFYGCYNYGADTGIISFTYIPSGMQWEFRWKKKVIRNGTKTMTPLQPNLSRSRTQFCLHNVNLNDGKLDICRLDW